MKKIYISDLDGTLLKNDATLSSYTQTTLKYLIEKGVNFTIASGRSIGFMQKIFRGIHLKLPIIEANGSFISDLKTGKHEIINEINPNITSELLEICQQYEKNPFVLSFNGKKDCFYYNQALNYGMKRYLEEIIKSQEGLLIKIPNLQLSLKDKVVEISIIDRRENLNDLVELIQSSFLETLDVLFFESHYFHGWYWILIHDIRATKDQAISMVLDKYNFKREDLTVFGDSLNDLKIFQLASRSVAVRNAKEELKEIATEIIESNEEDGVVKYIVRDLDF